MDLDKPFLEEILRTFNFNITELNINKLGNSSNLIYEFKEKDDEYILRISENTLEKLAYYEEEMNFIDYLFKGKANVSKVIPSMANKLVEVINYEHKCYFISVFEKAKGHIPHINNTDEWNEKLFYKWGRVMGTIHSLSKNYSLENKKNIRSDWNEDIYFSEEYSLKREGDEIYNVWNEILDEIKSLPKDVNSYGLIHYDFHQYNFFIYNDDITVFDFDDCMYHWFICDIAIAIYHAIESMKFTCNEEKNSFAFKFITNFLRGYKSENHLDDYWIEKIPLFLEYRRICSHNFILKVLSEKNIDNKISKNMEKRKYDIENRIPYIEVNFEGMI